jgi:hypothetical protein
VLNFFPSEALIAASLQHNLRLCCYLNLDFNVLSKARIMPTMTSNLNSRNRMSWHMVCFSFAFHGRIIAPLLSLYSHHQSRLAPAPRRTHLLSPPRAAAPPPPPEEEILAHYPLAELLLMLCSDFACLRTPKSMATLLPFIFLATLYI